MKTNETKPQPVAVQEELAQNIKDTIDCLTISGIRFAHSSNNCAISSGTRKVISFIVPSFVRRASNVATFHLQRTLTQLGLIILLSVQS